MEHRQALSMARLADAAADMIAQYPEAAAFVARRLAQVLDREAEESRESEREFAQQQQRRGFGS